MGLVIPSVAEQDEIIQYLKSVSESELIQRIKTDKEFRYTADAVFGCWRIRNQCRAIRLQRGYTQEELARRAGMQQPTIARLENIYAPMEITIGTLRRIARALDVTLSIKFTSWGEMVRDIIDTMTGSKPLTIPAFRDDPDLPLPAPPAGKKADK